MHHRGILIFLTLSIIFGIASSDSRNRAFPKTISRQGKMASKSEDEFERNIQILIDNIRSLSKEDNDEARGERSSLHQNKNRMTGLRERIASDGTNLDTYLTIFNSLYSIYQPMLVNSFIETLPQALICVLADRQNCGWQADLASTISSSLNQQILSLISSVKTEVCTPTFNVRLADITIAQLNSVQEMLTNALSSDLPLYLLSDNFITFWNGLMNVAVPPVLSFMSGIMSVLQTPVDFLQLGLQFGIEIPNLNRSENCQQGDLKQLIMWGMNHNVSWSFGQSLLDIFLGPESLPCIYPECQTSGSVLFGRTGSVDIPTFGLSCEQQSLNELNETLCAAILASQSQESYVLYQMCQAVSKLSQTEVARVWRNMCQMIQHIILPLMEPCSEPVTTKSSRRIARSALSLNELLCDYKNWTSAGAVDPALLSMCSENDREAFVPAVCNNANVMEVLLGNPSNAWVWGYCANSSDTYIVNLYCSYSTWTVETIDPSIVTFCWNNDMERMERLLCESIDFFMVVYSNDENSWLKPNCSEPPPQLNINALVDDSCKYSEWSDALAVTSVQLSLCIQNDEVRFIDAVCKNSAFVTALVLNSANAWVEQYCTFSIRYPPTSPPIINTEIWCDYNKWAEVSVDPSVVVLCWQYDQTGFRQNVCCRMTLYDQLTLHPDNQWLTRECADNNTVNTSTQSTVVDMTDLANVTTNVTANVTANITANGTSNVTANGTTNATANGTANITPNGTANITPNGTANGTANITANGTANVTANGTANITANGTANVTANGTANITPNGTANVTANVTANITPNGTANVTANVTANITPNGTANVTANGTANVTANGTVNVTPNGTANITPNGTANVTPNGTANVTANVTANITPNGTANVTANGTANITPNGTANATANYPANFTQIVCTNATVLQNLLANLNNTWLREHCTNLTGSSPGVGAENGSNQMGFQPAEQCQYSSWALVLPDASLLALCWDYDQANFISSICNDPTMLTHITQEASRLWVGTRCATYTFTNTPNVNESNSTQSQPCVTKELVRRLNWSCNADFSSVCQPGASQAEGLRMLLRCGIEILQPSMEIFMTTKMASMVRQATSLWVVLLLALEESQMTSLRVTENIRLSVLETMVFYMENETNFDNKRVLLQCFGRVLTSLTLTGRDGATSFFLIKEYFRIPLSHLRSVLSAADLTVIREILQYYNRNHATLQLTDEYLRTMVSVLFQTQLPRDSSLFSDMGLLLALATPSDIMSMPPLQDNINTLSIINLSIRNLSLEQQQAFGRWFSQSTSLPNISSASLSFIRDTGNLITYLPFHSFQYFSPAQLLNGLEVLMSNRLSPLKQQFIAQSVIGELSNLTADQFKSLGNLSCLANYNQLVTYTRTESFPVILDNIRTCVIQGVSIPSSMISSLVLNASELQSPSSLTSQRVSQLAPFLPLLGAGFLQQLTSAQLMPALSNLSSVPFTPTQAAVIVDKISANFSLAQPGSGHLSMLGSLVGGVKVETVWSLPADVLLEALPGISSQTGLSPAQTNTITTKLWGSASVYLWMDKVELLLSSTPLLSVIPRVSLLLTNDKAVNTRLWNTQQAQVLFKEATNSKPSLSEKEFISLGTVAPGVSCTAFKKMFQNMADTPSSLRDILKFLREQPVPLHASLKKCIIEGLYKFDFSELIGDLGSQVALMLPLSTIKKFSPEKMDSLRSMIVQDPRYFLLLPSTKQAVFVDKIVQRLDMYAGLYTEKEFRAMDVMATFVADEMFLELDRSFFVDSLEFLQGFCYSASKRDLVAGMLQEQRTFGPVQNWTSETLNQVDRFLFFLPKQTIQLIPAGLISLERIERLFLSQQRWEAGELGSLCGQEHSELFEKKQFVLQYFLGFLRVGRATFTGLIPSCESLYMTRPAAWTIDSLRNMPAAAFRRCLELIGQDSLFSAFQLSMLLTKTKEVYGTPSSFNTSVISQLGRIATQLSVDELASLKLSEIQAISAMGAINIWTSRQLKVIFSTVLNSTGKTVTQLDSSTLVALGYIVCGIEAAVISKLNATEFSKAVLWLGRLRLSCSEEQLQAMIGLLSQSSAFGPVSSWGTHVFIETGAIAAGLPDISMSALVREQIEGITPLAISLIPAKKFAVVFNQAQIQMFTYEQANAVTDSQRSVLSPVQKTALSMVLNPWEDKPVDFRGRSLAAAVHPSHFLCLSSVLLLLFITGPLG